MNLAPKVVRQIERGAKTQHCVPVARPTYVERPGPRGTIRTGDDSYYLIQPRKPAVGDSLIVQTAREHEIESRRRAQVRVIVTDVAVARIRDLTPDHARLQGYESLPAFARDWLGRHDTAWPPKVEAICKTCDGWGEHPDHDGQVIPCEADCQVGTVRVPSKPDDNETLTRLETAHGDHLIYLITFELQRDQTLFLSRRQYMPPTPSITEALDPSAPLLDPPSPAWKQRAEIHRREAVRDVRLAGLDRLAADLQAEAHRLAVEHGTDVTGLIRQLDHKVERIRRKLGDQDREAA